MPFEVIREAKQSGDGAITADRRLCLAEDGQSVVEANDGRARSLLCTAGDLIPSDRVKALGLELVDGRVAQKPKDPIPPSTTENGGAKEKEKPEDKQKSKPETKSATKH